MKRNLMLGLLLLAGCAGNAARETAASAGPHEQCLVCKHDADLACVDLMVTDATPSYAYGGKTYYFCSDTCKAKFVASPGKYAGR